MKTRSLAELIAGIFWIWSNSKFRLPSITIDSESLLYSEHDASGWSDGVLRDSPAELGVDQRDDLEALSASISQVISVEDALRMVRIYQTETEDRNAATMVAICGLPELGAAQALLQRVLPEVGSVNAFGVVALDRVLGIAESGWSGRYAVLFAKMSFGNMLSQSE